MEDHGALQDQVSLFSRQTAALNNQFQDINTERRQYKVESEIGASMSEMQAKQVVLLRWGGRSQR